jgi:hypothetical protein
VAIILHPSVTEQEHGPELLARLRDEARILGLLRYRAESLVTKYGVAERKISVVGTTFTSPLALPHSAALTGPAVPH